MALALFLFDQLQGRVRQSGVLFPEPMTQFHEQTPPTPSSIPNAMPNVHGRIFLVVRPALTGANEAIHDFNELATWLIVIVFAPAGVCALLVSNTFQYVFNATRSVAFVEAVSVLSPVSPHVTMIQQLSATVVSGTAVDAS